MEQVVLDADEGKVDMQRARRGKKVDRQEVRRTEPRLEEMSPFTKNFSIHDKESRPSGNIPFGGEANGRNQTNASSKIIEPAELGSTNENRSKNKKKKKKSEVRSNPPNAFKTDIFKTDSERLSSKETGSEPGMNKPKEAKESRKDEVGKTGIKKKESNSAMAVKAVAENGTRDNNIVNDRGAVKEKKANSNGIDTNKQIKNASNAAVDASNAKSKLDDLRLGVINGREVGVSKSHSNGIEIEKLKKVEDRRPAQTNRKDTPSATIGTKEKAPKPEVPIIAPAKLTATILLKQNGCQKDTVPSSSYSGVSSYPSEKMTTKTTKTNDHKENRGNDILNASKITQELRDSISGRPLSYPVYQRKSSDEGNIIKNVPRGLAPETYRRNDSSGLSSQPIARKNVFGPIPGSKSKVNSLEFLHKPQRVTQMNDDFISPEELQRNTNMNKKIIVDSAFPFGNSNNNDTINTDRSTERSPVTMSPEENDDALGRKYGSQKEKTAAIIKMTQDDSISPTEKGYPVLNKTDLTTPTIANTHKTHIFDHSYETLPVDDHMMPLPPVYKKSGELVKSSLKLRSKSLPVTPNSHSRLNLKNGNGDNIRGNLTRSKSVHFDQRLPVKYFFKEESPNVVSFRDEENDVLSFQHKPLQRSMDLPQGKKKLDLSRRLEDGFGMGATDLDMLMDDYDDDYDDYDGDGDGNDGGDDNDTIFTRGLKSLMIHDNNSLRNNFKDRPPEKTAPREATFGILNKNFPILGSKNPRSLKLNIFLNSSQEKKVFLQEVSLNVQKRKNFYNSTQYTPGDGDGDDGEKLIITGSILVKNIHYSKKVLVRYTWNHWRTSDEVESMYVGSGNSYLPGANMDIFRFMIDNTVLANGQYVSNKSNELEFCICYTTRANDSAREEYWDNNNGHNYIIEMQKRPS